MTTAETPLWITEADVAAVLDMGVAIAAVDQGLCLEATGQATSMAKTHTSWGGGDTLHAIGGVSEAAATVGTKTWAHTEGGATPLLVLFDARTGALRAIIEAFALGQLRTGAVSGVATDRMARTDADQLAIVGTGRQALSQVAAVAAVRPLRRVRVFGPDPVRRAAFRTRVEERLGLEAVASGSVAEAVADAPLVTLVTRATEPFLHREMVAEGAHINAVGAIVPSRTEFQPDLLRRCAAVAVDSVEQVRRLSSELRSYYGDDEDRWGDVLPLAATSTRPEDADLTLFKAMGVGLSDLSLGLECLRRARTEGRGRPFPHPERSEPELRSRPPDSSPSPGARA